jgi:flagellar export protein FliJ
MKRFEFRLASALKWRELQLQQQREQLSRALGDEQAAREALDRFRKERDAAREAVRSDALIDGTEMRALSAYLLGCEPRERALLQRLAAATRAAAEQRQKTMAADRRVRLIEKLEARQRAEWNAAADRHVETMAQETWTAVRQQQKANQSRGSSSSA